jgi:hypothetical protein
MREDSMILEVLGSPALPVRRHDRGCGLAPGARPRQVG